MQEGHSFQPRRLGGGSARETGRLWLACISLCLLVLAVYGQTVTFDFINLDDDKYLTGNPAVSAGLSLENVLWAFRATEVFNWHPLTWISHMADVEIFGLAPGGHHMVSVLFHAANSVLLCLLLWKMTGALWRSFLAAALFAVHPLHVESVAWVAERKDVLSTFLGILALGAYVSYAKGGRRSRFLLVFVLFALSLMAKPMLVTLPFLLLLLDFWPLGRWREAAGPARGRRAALLVAEKIPLFALSLASSLVTFAVQLKAGAVWPVELLPLSVRLVNSSLSYFAYLGKTLWPFGLAVFYPHPVSGGSLWEAVVPPLLLAAISTCALALSLRRPHLTVGWFWFVGTLVPVIGLVQVGGQGMADRYTYFPLVGIFIAAAWFIRTPRGGSLYRALLPAVTILIVGALVLIARGQTAYWKNSISLLSRTIEVISGNDPDRSPPSAWIVYYNLGHAYSEAGLHSRALEPYAVAAEKDPENGVVLYNMGNSYYALRNYRRAIDMYREAVTRFPALAEAYYNMGNAYLMLGMVKESREAFAQASSLRRGGRTKAPP